MVNIDEIDEKILKILKSNARTSLTKIAKDVGLSVMGVKNRISRLEEAGVIKGYSADINYAKLGYNIIALVGVKTEPKKRMNVIRELKRREEIIEMYEVTGTYDIIAKVAIKNMEELREFLAITMAEIPGVTETHTMIIINEHKR